MIYVYPKEYLVPVVFTKNIYSMNYRCEEEKKNECSDQDNDMKDIYDEIDESYACEEIGKKK